MRLNFRKISALASSALMLGMTAGLAAAANYPAPFVVGGAADVAIVYGSGAALSDSTAAGNIATSLSSFVSGGTGAVTTTGEVRSLDSSATRIWLNTSLNTARSSLTKTEMPTVLADTTFSGNVDAKLTNTIKLQAGAAAGSDNSGKVIFARQPKSSDDPVIGISLGASATSNPLYNASVTFSRAVNFTHTDSEGEDITLFGQKFTVATATDGTNLVLLKEAETFSLSSDSPTNTVTIGGSTYTVELVSASDTAATIKVTDSSGKSSSNEVSESSTKKIQGLEIAVKNADETNLKLSATVIAGAQKMTLTNVATITVGSDNTPIDGTTAHLVGGTTATTEIAVTVYRPDSSSDAITTGSSFTDPVFGSFKIDFAGLSSPLDSSDREMIEVGVVGDDSLNLKMTDHRGSTKTFDWAHNQSNQFFLGDDVNNTMNVIEMANLTEDEFIVLGNEEYGYLLQVTEIYNSSSSSAGDDRIKFRDVISGDTVSARSPTSEGTTTLSLGGKEYTITYSGPSGGAGSEGSAVIKYPTGDSANANTSVVYPTIQTQANALVAFYQPLNITLADFNGQGTILSTLNFPDGDGYTAVTIANASIAGSALWNFTVGSTTRQLNTTNATDVSGTLAIGRLTYHVVSTGTVGRVQLRLIDPDTASTAITTPSLIVFEGKDDSNNYEIIVIDAEPGDGTSTDGVGVNSVSLSSPTQYSATMQSDSDITKYVDWFGTLVTTDANDADQKTAKIAYPSTQVYAQIFAAESAAVVSGGGTLGDVLVTDLEVSTVSSKNLVVVGGSCINTAAASLVGGAYCGSAWTTATGAGTGQFLIKGYADADNLALTSKMALLVAGYEAADTTNAATYLRTQTVDTSKEYKGTSGTSATLVVA